MGPGLYDIEAGDALTRVRTTNITMGTSPSRAQMTQKTATTEIGPGQYAYEKQFGEETKTFRIGERRTEKAVETTAGPGDYDLERGDAITRVRTTNINMGSSPARGSYIQSNGLDVAPG